jgi:hypothetical protein
LEIAILNLFVNIKVRYQNLVVGKLDRQHVKAAMEKGISANQVSLSLPTIRDRKADGGRSSAICPVMHINKCITPLLRSYIPPSPINFTYGTRSGIG